MDGSAGIVASTATMGGVVAPASVTGGVPSGGTGGVVDPTSATGGTGGVIAATSASGGAPTGGMGGVFSFGGTFRFPSSMMGGFFFSSRVGGATGGNGGNAVSTGGTGGSSSQTGGSSGSSTTRSCRGVVEPSDPSVCWYLGAAGASCAQTCNSHGGVSPNAAKHVGTAAQGGSASKCENLFDLLGYKVSVYAVHVAAGLGCHLKPSMALPHAWASSPDYSDNAWESEVRIVCGCVF